MTLDLARTYSQCFLSGGWNTSGVKLYAERRAQLRERLSSICVVSGLMTLPGMQESWFQNYDRRVQDPSLLYLTGINQPGVVLVLDPVARGRASCEILFLPQVDRRKEFWEGAMLGVGDAAQLQAMQILTGIQDIRPFSELWEYLAQRLPRLRRNHCFCLWNENQGKATQDQLFRFKTRFQTFLRRHVPAMQLRNAMEIHLAQRVILDAERIKAFRLAVRYTKASLMELLSRFSSCSNEREVRVLLDACMQKFSSEGLHFPTIVAAGDQACILHYQKSDEPLESGRLVLLDFGLRVGEVGTDVSRTIPVNGRFNPLQKLLYQIVLDTLKFHQKQVRPGETLQTLNARAWIFLETQLQERFIDLGGAMQRAYEPAKVRPGDWIAPHGISHLIGEQVHEGDLYGRYKQEPLRAGMVISNEPGLYGLFEITLDGVFYSEQIGIRIEDDLLLTPKGCTNLTRQIPREIHEIETWMSHD